MCIDLNISNGRYSNHQSVTAVAADGCPQIHRHIPRGSIDQFYNRYRLIIESEISISWKSECINNHLKAQHSQRQSIPWHSWWNGAIINTNLFSRTVDFCLTRFNWRLAQPLDVSLLDSINQKTFSIYRGWKIGNPPFAITRLYTLCAARYTPLYKYLCQYDKDLS